MLVLTACQDNRSANDHTTAVAEAKKPATPLTVDEIRIGTVSDDLQGPSRPQTTRDPIRVAVKTNGSTQGADLEVKLFDLKNGQQAAIVTKRIKTDAPVTTEVTLSSHLAWEPGRYLVEVKLDGKLVGQRDVDIADVPAEPKPPR